MKVPKILAEHFELLADALKGMARLRQLILQFAVQGKLVKQTPGDEPAADLIARVAADRVGMITERVIRKAKPLPTLQPEELQFRLPVGWSCERMGNLFRFIDYRGKTPPKSETGIRLITAKNIRMGFLQENPREFVTKTTYDNWMTRGFPEIGDLLFTTEAPMGNVCLVVITEPFALAQRSINLHPFADQCSRYIMFAIMSRPIQEMIASLATGMTATGIKAAKLKLVPLPIPPLPEQKRIVAKVDELMDLCDELEDRQRKRNEVRIQACTASHAALTSATTPKQFARHWTRIRNHFDLLYNTPQNLQELRQLILQLAVQGKLVEQDPEDDPAGQLLARVAAEKERLLKVKATRKQPEHSPVDASNVPYQLPDGWRWARFGEVCLHIEAGWSPKCEPRPRNDDEWGVLKISAVTWGDFDANENKALPRTQPPRAECEVRPGDFIMSRANTGELVGKSVVVKDTPPRLLLNDKLLRVVFPKFVSRRYFNHFNNSSVARAHYLRTASGTSVSMRNISRENVVQMLVPVPPTAEQHRIVAKVDQLMALCDEMESKLTQSQADSQRLMEAVVQGLLNGAPSGRAPRPK